MIPCQFKAKYPKLCWGVWAKWGQDFRGELVTRDPTELSWAETSHYGHPAVVPESRTKLRFLVSTVVYRNNILTILDQRLLEECQVSIDLPWCYLALEFP